MIGPDEMVGMTITAVLDEIESSTDEDGMTTSSDEEEDSMMTISDEVEIDGSGSTVSAVVMGSVPSGQVSGGMA